MHRSLSNSPYVEGCLIVASDHLTLSYFLVQTYKFRIQHIAVHPYGHTHLPKV